MMRARNARFTLFLLFLGTLLFNSVAPVYLSDAVVASDQSRTHDEASSSQAAVSSNSDKRDVSAFSILDSLSGNATVLPTNFGEVKAVSYQGSTYLVVDEKGAKKFDSYLINMTYLYENGYLVRGDDHIGVIVQTSSLTDLPQAEGAVRNLNGIIHRMYSPHLPYLSATVPYASIQKLASTHSVAKVWLRLKVHVTLDQSVPIIKNLTEWSSLETQLGTIVNGTGITIAVIDTGIDSTHPDLAGKVVSSISFTGESPADGYGHGTHCASIAAGTGAASGGMYKGVAPGASLMNVKVLTNSGWGYNDWIISGIQWAVGNGADVLSMSFGADTNGDGTDPLSTTVDWAADQGVVPVVAAGNSGPGTFTVGTPAVARKAITVGATTKTDTIASFSSRGPTLDWRIKPDVLAPGVSIVAARAAGTSMGSPVDQFYTSASGTSMATPHVSGAAALLLQISGTQTPEQIKARLANSAVKLPLDVWVQGSGRIDCYHAATIQAKLLPTNWSFGRLTSQNSTSVSLANYGAAHVSFIVSTNTTVDGTPTDYVSTSINNGAVDGLQETSFTLTAGPIDESTPEGWFEGWLSVEWFTDPAQTLHFPYLFMVTSDLDVTVYDLDGSIISALITVASYPNVWPLAASVYSFGTAHVTARSGEYAVFAQLAWVRSDYGRMFALEQHVTVPRLSSVTVSFRLADANVSYISTKSSTGEDLKVHAYVQMLNGGTPNSRNLMQWETLGGRFGGDITTDKLTLYTTTYDPADKVSLDLGFYASDTLHSEVYLMPFKFWNVANLPTVIEYPKDQLAVWDVFFDVPEVYPAKGLRIMNAFWFTWDYTGGFQFWSWDTHEIYVDIKSKYYLGPNSQWPWFCYMPTYADHEINYLWGPLEEVHINNWTWPGPTGDPPATGQTGSINPGNFEFAPYTPGLTLQASGGQVQLAGDIWRELQWPRYDWRGGTTYCGGIEGNFSPYPRINPAYRLKVDGATVAEGELSGGKYLNCSEAGIFGADWTGINRTWTIADGEVVVETTLPSLAVLSSESQYKLRLDLSSGDPDAPAITSLSYPRNYTLGQEIEVSITAEDTSGIASVEVLFSYDGETWNPASYEAGIARFTIDYDGSDSINLLIRVTDNSGNYAEFVNRPAMLNARTILRVDYPPVVPAGSTALIGGNLTTVAGNPVDKLALNFSSEPPSFYVLVDQGVIRQFSLNVTSRVQHTLTLFPVGLYGGEAASFTIQVDTSFAIYPYMFIVGGAVTGDVPVGASHAHDPCGAAHTIDVVGTDLIVMSLGHYADTGGMNAMMDIQAAHAEGSTIVLDVEGNIITAGGPPVNYVWKYYNDLGTLPAYFSPLGTVYVPSTGHSHSLTNDYYQGKAVTDYAIVELYADGSRNVLLVAGISGFATYYASQWLQQKTLDGTIRSYNAQAIILRLDDADGDPIATPPTITVIEEV